MAFLPRRIKQSRRNEILHPGQHSLKLVENLSASQSEFEALGRTNQEVILTHCAYTLECPAYSRLAQSQPVRSSRNAFFLRDRCKRSQEVQINLAQFL